MILELLWKAVDSLLSFILFPFSIPQIPLEVENSFYTFITSVIKPASQFIDIIFPLDIFKNYLSIVLIVWGCTEAYKLFMFFLKKIPMINIH